MSVSKSKYVAIGKVNGRDVEVVLDMGADVTLVPDNLVPDIELC